MQPGPSPDVQQGVMPYWRVALEPHWGDHYLMIGTFGMYGQTSRRRVRLRNGQLHRHRLRFAVPVRWRQIQRHREAADIIENQKFNASVQPGRRCVEPQRSAESFKANASFVWDHTYSVNGRLFQRVGNGGAGLRYRRFGAGAVSSPNGDGLIFDVAYLPFSHGSPGLIRPRTPASASSTPSISSSTAGRRTSTDDRNPARRHAQRLRQQHAVPLCVARLLSRTVRYARRWRIESHRGRYRQSRVVLGVAPIDDATDGGSDVS